MMSAAVGKATDATSTAPWWGIPVIAGGFLVAVALLTFGANLILKRIELARADRSKWDDDILDLSLEIKRLTDEMVAVGTTTDPAFKESITERLPIYRKNSQAMGPPVDKLGLIASEELSKAAVGLMLAAMNQGLRHDYSHMAPKERKVQEKKAARIPKLEEASKIFNAAVRKELRAKG